jgi:hypothetical protein
MSKGDPEFHQFINQIGRVQVIRRDPPLPLHVAAVLAARVRWLREELPTLDRELGLTYPPIEILPAAWLNTLSDGTHGIVPGRVGVASREGDNYFVVQLSAPALMEYGDDLIRGVLAHEFLHVVFYTIAIRQHADSDSGSVPFEMTGAGYSNSWTDYRRVDKLAQVTPEDWLNDKLQRLAQRVEDANIDAIVAAMTTNWVDEGLPVESPLNEIDGTSILLDESINQRAREIAADARR